MSETAIANPTSLAARLRGGEFIAAPGVYDMISAKIADRMGFPALYMTGSGVVASHLGLPDAGIATYTEMVARAAQIAGGTRTPLIADADTGYGGTVNVRHTVQGYERAGVSAIQIEDQAFPKKCGHTEGMRIVPLDEMVRKIKVAQDSRFSDDFLIIARTDARKAADKAEALRRLEAFQEAGADILFFEAPASVDEMKEAASLVDAPLMANMVHGGLTPIMTPAELAAIGYRVAIFPAVGFLAATEALTQVYGALAEHGSTAGANAALHDFTAFNELMGFREIIEFEDRFEGAG